MLTSKSKAVLLGRKWMSSLNPLYDQELNFKMHSCSSKGKNLVSKEQELRSMAWGIHRRSPVE